VKARMILAGAALLAQFTPAIAQHMNLATAPCRKPAVTVDAHYCFAAAAKSADAHLGEYLSRVRRSLGPSQIATLDKAQSLWAQFREANCSAERDLYKGGSGGPVTYEACLEAQARTRLTDLRIVYGWQLWKKRNSN
jgi:uncharacterized protein YecT (DUF1311 family)